MCTSHLPKRETSVLQLLRTLLFLWLTPVLRAARSGGVSSELVAPLAPQLSPRNVPAAALQATTASPFGFLRETLRPHRSDLVKALSWAGARVVVESLRPGLLFAFVAALEASRTALPWGVALAGVIALEGIVIGNYFFTSERLEFHLANAAGVRIFRHGIFASGSGRDQGMLLSHMGHDVDTVAEFPPTLIEFLHDMAVVVVASIMLFQYLGWSAAAAVAVLLALVPLSRLVSRRFEHVSESLAQARDGRQRLLSVIIPAMRLVKGWAQEKNVESRLAAARARELECHQRNAGASALSRLVYALVQTVVCVAAFGTWVLTGHELDAATVFACLALLGLLYGPIGDASAYLAQFAAARVAAERICAFLNDAGPARELSDGAPVVARELVVHGENGACHLDLSLELRPGEAVAVVGPVGSGKSLLLKALLGEVRHAGVAALGPRAAYLPQEAWAFVGSLRDNICLGNPDVSLEVILHAACLAQDVARLPDGAETVLGERGVTLSGGQRQRLGLARAMASEPDIVLLDDPFSSVDAATEKALVERLLFGVWQGRTRLVVTHRLQHLDRFDRIVFLENGRIGAQGTLATLLEESPRFRQFHASMLADEAVLSDVAGPAGADGEGVEMPEMDLSRTGRVERSTWLAYLRTLTDRSGSESRLRLCGLLLLTAFAVTVPRVQDAFLGWWTAGRVGESVGNSLFLYAALGFAAAAATTFNDLAWMRAGVHAGRVWHQRSLQAVLRTPLAFFDRVPAGYVLNRLARDVAAVDTQLPAAFLGLFFAVGSLVSIAVSMAIVQPWLVLILPLLGLLQWRTFATYGAAWRDLRRLSAASLGPRLALFREGLAGAALLRLSSRQHWFLERFLTAFEASQRMMRTQAGLRWWFSVQNHLLNGALVLAACVVASWMGDVLPAGIAVLAISWAMNDGSRAVFQAGHNLGGAESGLTSVERLQEYADLPEEPSAGNAPPPVRGDLEVSGLRFRYAPEQPWVLDGFSCVVPHGTFAAIVGPTGSGKSSLFQALLRFYPYQEGEIRLGGTDIRTVPLARLRESIAFVPQEPMFFPGTLRENLLLTGDAGNLEETLARVGLAEVMARLPGGLDHPVHDGKGALSLGQRQMFCLARALLHRAPLILLDETTAHVDVETERLLVQALVALKGRFTILAIAHRPEMAAQADMVIRLGC